MTAPGRAPIRGVLFDKDGTLVDYDLTWRPTNWLVVRRLARGDEALARELLGLSGHDPEADRVAPHSIISAGTALELAEVWGPRLGRRDLAAIAREIDAGFIEGAVANLTAVPGLTETLVALRRLGLHLGLATSDSEEAAHRTLELLGITEHFSFVCGYDSGHGGKPEPGMVRAFCGAVSLEAPAVAMVGDSHHDLLMGRAAGVGLNVGVLTGPAPAEDLAPHADLVLDDVRGLLSHLHPA